MDTHLHIVCLDVPYPADYGGVFDLFYKLKYLHEQGIVIHLHCFEYGRGRQDSLLRYCATVQYYKRSGGWRNLLKGIPYMVGSRSDSSLYQNLANDHYPVLLEGIHCTYFLHQKVWTGRKVFLRLHNIEFEYYRALARHTTSFFYKCYYLLDSFLLHRYERKTAPSADLILTVTEKDAIRYQHLYGKLNILHLPLFIPWSQVTCRTGKGAYCLYQGNLAVSENERAAIWLIENVFALLSVPLIIAGKNPGAVLKRAVNAHAHIKLVNNPGDEAMQKLIEEAQINLLPSFTTTGIKLKLLHAIFCGRHCVANKNMVDGTGLEGACVVAENEKEFRSLVQSLFSQPFSQEDVAVRQTLLTHHFNNQLNAKNLADRVMHPDIPV